MTSETAQKSVLLLFLAATTWLSFYILQPPEPQSATVPETSFSAERAFKHVEQIAQRPHPMGSAANDSVRKYIVEQLKSLGLDPTIQQGVGARIESGVAGYPKNIIAEMPGQDPDKTILLMAHYDSVPNAPGAGDDASGVSAILEAVRAIQSQDTPLKNNILILLTDGEERGLLGAELFTDKYRDFAQIDLVLNFEARGSSGASMMFETSAPNAKLIQHFAEATPDPVANSLMYTVYKLMPNDTDLTVMKDAGLKGLNFAFAEELLNYHTMQDNPENLSLASLQHHGSNLLNNLRHFGNTDFILNGTSEYVYFNNATGGILYYPAGWSLPLAAVTGLLFAAYLVFLFRTGQLTLGSYLGSLLLFLGMIIVAALGTYFGWQAIKALHPGYRWLAQGETYSSTWYLWGFTLLFSGIFSVVYSLDWIQKKLTTQQLISGGYTFWVLLSLISAWYLPTASYIFTWPVLIALVGWIVLGSRLTESSWKATGILAASSAAVLFMIPPYLYLVQVMLTTEMLAVSMVLLILILGLAWPLIWRIIRTKKILWNSGLLLAAAFCFVTASATSGYDAEHKKQNSISYIQNLDTHSAYWVSRDDTIDSWSRQFLGKNYQRGTLPNTKIFNERDLLYAPADIQQIPSPRFEILEDSTADSLRYLSLRMHTNYDGIGLRIDWTNSSIEELSIHGKTLYSTLHPLKEQPNNLNRLYYFQDLSKPIPIDLILDKTKSTKELTFTFIRMGLPTQLIPDYKERQPHMMPPPNSISDASLWQTTIGLGSLKSSR